MERAKQWGKRLSRHPTGSNNRRVSPLPSTSADSAPPPKRKDLILCRITTTASSSSPGNVLSFRIFSLAFHSSAPCASAGGGSDGGMRRPKRLRSLPLACRPSSVARETVALDGPWTFSGQDQRTTGRGSMIHPVLVKGNSARKQVDVDTRQT